jgi:hypothetical protein
MQPRFAAFPILLLAAACARLEAQTYDQDTAAVRVILSANQIDFPIAQVTATEQGRVVSLDLEGLQITAIPREIGSLTALRRLNLSRNLLDTLPAEIWGLGRLAQLDLGGNRLRALGEGVGALRDLLFLGLRDNDLGSLPGGLFELAQLEILLLSHNGLDSLPEGIASFPFLRYLDVSHNSLRSVPGTLAALDGLDSLDLRSNLLETLPELFLGMGSATKVRLEGNHLCAMPAALEAWASSRDPAWRDGQNCGASIRNGRTVRGGIRVEKGPEGYAPYLVLRLPPGRGGLLRIAVRDLGGRVLETGEATATREGDPVRIPLRESTLRGTRIVELSGPGKEWTQALLR